MGDRLLGDIYRPVDRPTDPYAQVGETIGGYLIPGLGTAGNMVAGSVAEAANQKGDFAENVANNAAINLGAQGLLSGAAKAISRGVKAANGSISPEAQKILIQTKKNNVPIMTTDIIEPTNKIGRQLQDYSEWVIMGTGTMRAAQNEARAKLINEFTERYGDYDPTVVVRSLKSGVANEKKLAGDKLKNISAKMVGKPVDISGTVRAIDGAVDELSRLKGVSDAQTISALKDYKQAIQETLGGEDAFELLDKLRTQFRIGVKGDRTALPTPSQAMIDRVYNSITNSLNRSITKVINARDAALWRSGKADYARMAADSTQTKLKNVLNKGDLTPEAVNSIIYGQYGSDIARIYGKLDQKGKDMLRAAYISKIADKANGSPQRMMNELNKLSKQANGQVFKTVFSGKYRKEIEGLMAVLDATKRAPKSNIVTQTGMTLSAPIRVFGNIITGGLLMAGEAGIGLLSRVYESPGTRNALLRLANTKPSTPSYERALDKAVMMVRPILVNQATQQQ